VNCNLAKQCQPFFLVILFLLPCAITDAKRPEYELTLESHLFYPAQIIIPAHKKIKLVIFNLDNSVEEFDSFDLNREKVIFPQQKAIIFIGPLPAGEYEFFGEYNSNSARGKVIVVEHEELKAQGGLHVN